MRLVSEKNINALIWIISSFLILIGITYHQPWRDEGQAIMLAQDATSFGNLVERIRWEGHPILWFAISALTGPALAIWVNGLFGIATNALIVFKSPWPKWIRWSLPFSYLFLFEFSVIARNYAIGAFLLFTAIYFWENRKTTVFFLLLLATQTNFFAGTIALSLGLLLFAESPKEKSWIWKISLAILVGLFTIYEYTPPSSGGFASEWTFHSTYLHQALITSIGSLVFPLFPNSHPFVELFVGRFEILAFTIVVASFTYFLKSSKHRWVFAIYALTMVLFCSFKLFAFTRHLGHIWLLFLLLLWKENNNLRLIWKRPTFVQIAVVTQVIAGCFNWYWDVSHDYSTSKDTVLALNRFQISNHQVAVFPDHYGAGLSLVSNTPYYLPIRDTVMTHTIWDEKSQVDLYPKTLKKRLSLHFSKSSCYLVTPIDMLIETPRMPENIWKNELQPELIWEAKGATTDEIFRVYKIQLLTDSNH